MGCHANVLGETLNNFVLLTAPRKDVLKIVRKLSLTSVRRTIGAEREMCKGSGTDRESCSREWMRVGSLNDDDTILRREVRRADSAVEGVPR